jgi:hypothetical protein
MTSLSLEPVRLKYFFEQFRKAYHKEAMPSQKEALPVLNEARFKEFIVSFAPLYKNFHAAGFNLNVFDVLDFRHDEVKNARILTWLFDPHGSHGQGKAVWHSFLSIVQQKNPDSAFLNLEHWHNYHVKREVYPHGDSENRIDLVLESLSAILFIEVKIYAPEGFEQTNRYNEALSRYEHKQQRGLIYLTRKGVEKGEDCLSSTWRDVAFALKAHKASKATPFGFFSSQFSRHITNF